MHVVFDSGLRRTFDLVVGADGLHSNTRRLVFGPEEPFHRYLGHVFAGFTLPNEFGLAHEAVIWNEPGRSAVLYAHEPAGRLHGFLTFTREAPPFDAFRDPRAQRDRRWRRASPSGSGTCRGWSRACARPTTSSSTS